MNLIGLVRFDNLSRSPEETRGNASFMTLDKVGLVMVHRATHPDFAHSEIADLEAVSVR